jgi:SAF domain
VPEPHSSRSIRDSLTRILGRWRRRVLLRRRWLAAALAGVAVVAGLQATMGPPPLTQGVLTAARDLPGGTVLRSTDVTVTQLDPDAVPAGITTQPVGRRLASPLRRGEPVTDARLVGHGLLDGHPGLTATPIRIPDPAVVDLLRVGDTFDLLATDPEGTGTRVIAHDALVVAIPESTTDAPSIGISGSLIVIGTPPLVARDVTNAALQEFLSVAFSP